MPFPVSWTNSSTFSHPCGERKPKVMLPLSVNFAAFVDEVVDDLLEPRRVGDYRCVRLRHVEPQTDAFRHAEPLSLINIRQQSVQRVLPEMEFHGVRFDLRKVEDVRNQAQQLVSVARYEPAVLLLLRLAERDVFAGEQVGEADDGVEGRAYLVAHVGQKRAFQPVALPRLVAGCAQSVFGGLVGVDALAYPHDAVGRSVAGLSEYTDCSSNHSHVPSPRRSRYVNVSGFISPASCFAKASASLPRSSGCTS